MRAPDLKIRWRPLLAPHHRTRAHARMQILRAAVTLLPAGEVPILSPPSPLGSSTHTALHPANPAEYPASALIYRSSNLHPIARTVTFEKLCLTCTRIRCSVIFRRPPYPYPCPCAPDTCPMRKYPCCHTASTHLLQHPRTLHPGPVQGRRHRAEMR